MDRALTAAAAVVLALALVAGPNVALPALPASPVVDLGGASAGDPPAPYVPTTVPDADRDADADRGIATGTPPSSDAGDPMPSTADADAPTGPDRHSDSDTTGHAGSDDGVGSDGAVGAGGDAADSLSCVSPNAGTGEWVVVVFYDGENRTELGNATLEVANEVEEWERGLMGRETLADRRGMLFEFPDEAPRSFWMKDTLVALDVVFADEEGVVLNVAHAVPEPGVDDEDLRRYPSDGSAQYVVEVNAGVANETGIGPGTQLWFEDAEYCR